LGGSPEEFCALTSAAPICFSAPVLSGYILNQNKTKPPVYPTGGLFHVASNRSKLVVAPDHFSKQEKHDGSVKDNHADH
jgi:hypothetical protein